MSARLSQLKVSVKIQLWSNPAAASQQKHPHSRGLRVTTIFAEQTHATNTKDHTFYIPVAETICTTEPNRLANAGRMLSFTLKHSY